MRRLNAEEKAGQWVPFTVIFNSEKNDSISLRIGTSEDFKGTCYWDDVVIIEQK